MRFLSFFLAFLSLVHFNNADTYMLWPRASNNRLDETGRDRNNGNRLFDSQNNDRGGVNAGARYQIAKTGNDKFDIIQDVPYYYEGSILPIYWTMQHACGNPNVQCEVIIQYMCDDLIRDGRTTNTIPFDNNNATRDIDYHYGRHESWSWYQSCRARSRNRGLFTADRDLRDSRNRKSAEYTRQNNDGTRRGYECPEERDYYPYWVSTPWKDIVIFTDELARCAAYQAESQNVKGRYECRFTQDEMTTKINNGQNGFIPLVETECSAAGGSWVFVAPWDLPAPECKKTQYSRDNHHGHVGGNDGYPMMYNWTIPADFGDNCVLRLRYNMSSSDLSTEGIPTTTEDYVPSVFGWAAKNSIQAGIDSRHNSQPPTVSNTDPNTRPSKLPIWAKYGLTDTDVAQSFSGATENTYKQSRGYVWMQGNQNGGNGINLRQVQVDIFGPLLDGTKNSGIFFQLAIDTTQFSRAFQDRSHVFSIVKRTPDLVGRKIYNIGVYGKRGNIVQTFPSTEYDFVPNRLVVKKGDLVHFQWVGSNTNPPNNDPNDNEHPPGYDRSNVIVARNPNYIEPGMNPNDQTTTGHLNNVFPGRIDRPSVYPFLGLSYRDLQALAVNGVNNSYFDLGPRQVTRSGIYHYLSTINNNFSNRNHQGTIVVEDRAPGEKEPSAYTYNPSVEAAGAWIEQPDYDEVGTATGGNYALRAWPSSMGSDYIEMIGRFSPATGKRNDVSQQPPIRPLNVWLAIPFKQQSLHTAQVQWKPSATASDDMLVDVDTVVSGQVAKVAVQRGGVYVVNNKLNAGAVAGVVVGSVAFIAGCAFVFWYFKMRPVGGFSAWNEYRKTGKIPAKPVSSPTAGYAPSGPVSTFSPVVTSSPQPYVQTSSPVSSPPPIPSSVSQPAYQPSSGGYQPYNPSGAGSAPYMGIAPPKKR